MVKIRMSNACAKGNHDQCEGDRSPPKRPNGEIVFGGWRCPCRCHDKDRKAERKMEIYTPIRRNEMFNEGDVVEFNIGSSEGTGIIRGYVNELPVIGRTYIVEVINGIDKNTYPYSCFSCSETHLEKVSK